MSYIVAESEVNGFKLYSVFISACCPYMADHVIIITKAVKTTTGNTDARKYICTCN